MSSLDSLTEHRVGQVGGTAQIVLRSGLPPAVYAAELLQSWLSELFNLTATICGEASEDVEPRFVLRVDEQLAGGCPQHYHILPGDRDGMLDIVASSAAGLIWAVAELGEHWGIRYLTYQDVLPRKIQALSWSEEPIKRKPIFTRRAVRLYNDFPNDHCCWSIDQHRPLIDQLAKMRFNEVVMFTRPLDPFFDLSWRGARKDDAGACCYGLEYPISRDTIGYDHFVASGDAQRGRFENPDLHGHPDYEQTLAAGQQYLQGIRQLTRDRGMSLRAQVLLRDFQEPIRRKLVEETDASCRLPIEPGRAKRMRYGKWVEGPGPEVLACMSLRNPAYLDLMRTTLQSYVDAYDGFDYLYIWTSEFRGSQSDLPFAWEELNNRYGLDAVCTLDELIATARKQAEIDPDRAEHEVKADICTLWCLDYVLQVNPVECRETSPAIVPSGINWNLHKLIPLVFGGNSDYLASLGYMPTTAAQYAATLPPSASAVLTLEDDNIGPVPQVSSSSLSKTVATMQQRKQSGYITRQWNLAKTQPALNYLAHASWEPGLDVETVTRDMYEPICGKPACDLLIKALGELDALTVQMQRDLECVAFLSPRIILGRWGDGEAAPFGEILRPERYGILDGIYQKVIETLSRACDLSSDGGRPLIEALRSQSEFAKHWIEALRRLAISSHQAKAAAEAKTSGDAFAYDAALRSAADETLEAKRLVRQATQSWSQCIEDRCDLGTLAALNSYGVKVIDAIQYITYIRANNWNLDL